MRANFTKFLALGNLTTKILIFALLLALLLPVLGLVILSNLPQHFSKELNLSLANLPKNEGKHWENLSLQVLRPYLRQRLEVLAQKLTNYLENHPGRTWNEISRDPQFRELSLQSAGFPGPTFLISLPDNRLIWHPNPSYEGQPLDQVLGHKINLPQTPASSLDDKSFYQEFIFTEGQTQGFGCFMPLLRQPLEGPVILLGVWVNRRDLEIFTAHSQYLYQQLGSIGITVLDTALSRFRRHLLPWLGALGVLILGFALVMARQFHSRVNSLSQAVQAYTRGELSHRLRNPGQDELGHLARHLNAMADALQEQTVSRWEWENTFDSLPDLVMLVDRQGCLTRINRAASAFLRLSPEEVKGQHYTDLNDTGPEGFPIGALDQVFRQGIGIRQEFCTVSDRSFLITVEPAWEGKDRLAGAVLIARDITFLRDTQRELSRISHFLEKLITSAPLGLVFVDPEGLIHRTNSQFSQEFGYRPADILGRHYFFLFVSEAERQQLVAELEQKGELLGRQVLLRHAEGHPVPARLSLRLLKGDDNRHLGYVALVSNISEEVNLQRQLELAQRQEAIATLAGGLAHNFNNLLTIILGLVTLMHGKISPDHPAFSDLMDIERQVRAGRDITQKLLSFRRGPDFKTQPLDLNRLVATTADMFGRTRPELIIRQKLVPNLPAVEGDPGQIQQVLMNLLINAWQSMPYGGVITLETRAVQITDWHDREWDIKPGNFVCLSVADTGTGMDEGTIARLFEPFFTTKGPGQGSGLGLASAARIMKNHQGAIQVRSRPGEGSTFTLFFPASTARPRLEAPEEGSIIPGRGTILVVDDDPTLRRVAGKLLEKLGYRVLEAPSGEGALEIYAQNRGNIDLVLLDILMPGLNGLQTMERLRTLDPQVRILLVSGVSDSPEEALPPGVDFLTKPFPLGLLSQKVAQALNQ